MKREEIEDWADEVSFDHLSETEQAWVRSIWSEASYRNRYHFAAAIRLVSKEEVNDLEVKDFVYLDALNKIKEQNKSIYGWVKFVQHKIPTWTAIAAVLVIMLSMIYMQFSVNQTSSRDKTNSIVKIDTVFIRHYIQDTIKEFEMKQTEKQLALKTTNQKEAKELQFTNQDSSVLESSERGLVNLGLIAPMYDTVHKNYSRSLKNDVLAQKVLRLKL